MTFGLLTVLANVTFGSPLGSIFLFFFIFISSFISFIHEFVCGDMSDPAFSRQPTTKLTAGRGGNVILVWLCCHHSSSLSISVSPLSGLG